MAGVKILVADDSLTIQKVIRLALANEGYDIQAVSNGIDASEQIAHFQPDIVLVDVSLPGKSAFEIKEDLQNQSDPSRAHFILMCSAFEQIDEQRAQRLNFEGRLVKPFDPGHLRKVIQDAMGEEGQNQESQDSQDSDVFPDFPLGAHPAEPRFNPASLPKIMPPPPPLRGKNPFIPPAPAPSFDSEKSGFLDLSMDQIKSVEIEQSQTPPPFPNFSESESDIRQLTESTIKMSGLEEMQWNLDERMAKGQAPRPPQPPFEPPSSKIGEIGENTFAHLQIHEPALPPPPSFRPDATTGDTLGDVDDEPSYNAFFEPAETPRLFSNTDPKIEPARVPLNSFQPEESSQVKESDVIPLSTEQMETMIEQQLQKTLEKMAEKMLPNLAEKIIKQEIHRLLSSPPD